MVMVKNTLEMKQLRRAVSSLALENMYVSEEFLKKLIEASENDNYDELRKEVIKKYAR